jgi:hypothetical protein
MTLLIIGPIEMLVNAVHIINKNIMAVDGKPKCFLL